MKPMLGYLRGIASIGKRIDTQCFIQTPYARGVDTP